MTSYVSFIETSGNTSLAKSDVPAVEAVLSDNPGSTYVAAYYQGRYIDLYFTANSSSQALTQVPSSWWANQRSPIAAEVRPGEDVVTVFFQTQRRINIESSLYAENAIQVVQFSLQNGVETGRYNFNTKRFEALNPPRGLEWGDYYDNYTAEYVTGNTAAFDKEYSSYGISAAEYNRKYQQAISTFSSVLNPSASSGASSSSSKTSVTTNAVDNIIGTNGTKDIVQFSGQPQFNTIVDRVTGLSTKDKDSIQISNQAFGVANGTFAIAKKAKSLNKLLSTNTNFIYNQQRGELIFNANGAEPGFGTDGGVFAQLVGNPKITPSSVSFI